MRDRSGARESRERWLERQAEWREQQERALGVAPRDDARWEYGAHPDAVLHGWAGDEWTMPMGSWLDGDEEAFEAAMRDELTYADAATGRTIPIDIHRAEPGCCSGLDSV